MKVFFNSQCEDEKRLSCGEADKVQVNDQLMVIKSI